MIRNRAKALILAATLIVIPVAAVPAQAQTGYLGQHLGSANQYLASRSGMAGLTAIDTSTGEIVSSPSGSTQIRSASVIKVAIGAAALGRIRAIGRSLSPVRSTQLASMIKYSDNDATTALWNANGGGAGVLGYVKSKVPGLAMHVDYAHPTAWGYTYVSSRDLALLGNALLTGKLLAWPDAKRLLDLMHQVTPSQAWGIPQAFPGLSVAVKNGWYPDTEQGSWRVTCLGMTTPPGRAHPLVIAVTTKYPLSLGQGYGEQTCRYAAARLVPMTGGSPSTPPVTPPSGVLTVTQYYDVPLRVGLGGPAVKAFQTIINMPVAQRDGIYGPVTAAAVRAFQTRVGLPATGVVDKTTWWLADLAQPGQVKPVLRLGSRSSVVRMAKVALGMPVAARTVYFDATTQAAVIAFQRAHRLTPDGIVGPITWHALGF